MCVCVYVCMYVCVYIYSMELENGPQEKGLQIGKSSVRAGPRPAAAERGMRAYDASKLLMLQRRFSFSTIKHFYC